MSRSFAAVALLGLFASGCAGPAARTAPPAAVAEPAPAAPAVSGPAPNDNLNAVAWTQTAIERDLIYRQAWRDAQDQLARARADRRWEALPEGTRKAPYKGRDTAVIVDVDETVLDNSPYQARLVKQDASFNEFTWAEWCREERAAAIPGALEFARHADKLGVTVFYLSNRASDLREPTLANLRKLGFPVPNNKEVFLGLGTFVEGCEQDGSEKGCRRQLIARDHRVLMQVGDQLGDFVDIEANTLDGRRQAVAPYLDWIGTRWFVLPNPTYGSWEPALFNNSWSQPAEQRRQAKLDALRTQ
jgi:5'-nucleotidase (lipoprotein e(P4) family)